MWLESQVASIIIILCEPFLLLLFLFFFLFNYFCHRVSCFPFLQCNFFLSFFFFCLFAFCFVFVCVLSLCLFVWFLSFWLTASANSSTISSNLETRLQCEWSTRYCCKHYTILLMSSFVARDARERSKSKVPLRILIMPFSSLDKHEVIIYV
mgnify:CR=1 FL=1